MEKVMTEDEKRIIISFARGQRALRDEAVAIYRRHVHDWVNGGDPKCPYMGFLSEVDNPCPDLGLRAHHRAALIELSADAS
jgi:hypothetical protein